MNSYAVIEGLKQAARTVLVAIIPIVLTSINTEAGTFNINWNVVLATAVTALLLGLDKFVHKSPDIKANGITGF